MALGNLLVFLILTLSGPTLYDAARVLPSADTCRRLRDFNAACQCQLKARLSLEPWRDDLAVELREAKTLWRIWDLAYGVQTEAYGRYQRRQWLILLVEQIGVEEFYAGWMPVHVPVWRWSALR